MRAIAFSHFIEAFSELRSRRSGKRLICVLNLVLHWQKTLPKAYGYLGADKSTAYAAKYSTSVKRPKFTSLYAWIISQGCKLVVYALLILSSIPLEHATSMFRSVFRMSMLHRLILFKWRKTPPFPMKFLLLFLLFLLLHPLTVSLVDCREPFLSCSVALSLSCVGYHA